MKKIILLSLMLFMVLSTTAVAISDQIIIQNASAAQNQTVSTMIVVYNSSGVSTIQLNLQYDPTVVIGLGGDAPSYWNVNEVIDTDNATDGIVRITVAYSNATVRNLLGNLIVANITLKAVGTPRSTSPLNLTVVDYATDDGVSKPSTVQYGTFTIVPKGDVDGYVGITMADAMVIGKYAVGKINLDNPDSADVDGCTGGRNNVSINDALYLAKYVIGVPGFADLAPSVCKSAG